MRVGESISDEARGVRARVCVCACVQKQVRQFNSFDIPLRIVVHVTTSMHNKSCT